MVSAAGKLLSSEFDLSGLDPLADRRIVVGRCCESGDSQSLDEEGHIVERVMAAPALGDYLVVGVDVSLLDKKALVRLFTIWDLGGIYFEEWNKDQNKRVRTHKAFYTDEGLSAVIYPEVQYDFGQGFRLSLGAFLQLGKDYTKFGEAAAGGSSVWTRGTFAF